MAPRRRGATTPAGDDPPMAEPPAADAPEEDSLSQESDDEEKTQPGPSRAAGKQPERPSPSPSGRRELSKTTQRFDARREALLRMKLAELVTH